jgi:hypothetical protein
MISVRERVERWAERMALYPGRKFSHRNSEIQKKMLDTSRS